MTSSEDVRKPLLEVLPSRSSGASRVEDFEGLLRASLIPVELKAVESDVDGLGPSNRDLDQVPVFDESENRGAGSPQKLHDLSKVNENQPFCFDSSHRIWPVLG